MSMIKENNAWKKLDFDFIKVLLENIGSILKNKHTLITLVFLLIIVIGYLTYFHVYVDTNRFFKFLPYVLISFYLIFYFIHSYLTKISPFIRFNYRLIIFFSVLAISNLFSFNSGVLNLYSNLEETPFNYDWNNPFDILKFPLDQLRINNKEEIIEFLDSISLKKKDSIKTQNLTKQRKNKIIFLVDNTEYNLTEYPELNKRKKELFYTLKSAFLDSIVGKGIGCDQPPSWSKDETLNLKDAILFSLLKECFLIDFTTNKFELQIHTYFGDDFFRNLNDKNKTIIHLDENKPNLCELSENYVSNLKLEKKNQNKNNKEKEKATNFNNYYLEFNHPGSSKIVREPITF
jgi:hypothetical protein